MAREPTGAGAADGNALPSTLSARPTKVFFVSMLTRDIELQDAVLDLLDNCIDGVIRTTKNCDRDPKRPYAGFHAHITMEPGRFEIVDNCGGIPAESLDKAFRMGRPPDALEPTGSTVGMYGIGMKRAVFKLGNSCSISSSHGGVGFVVTISPEWMKKEEDWDLPVAPLGADDDLTGGTRIVVDVLRPDVALKFDRAIDSFVDEFETSLAQHYALIIDKGFEVTVNGEPIAASGFSLLIDTTDATGAGTGLRPYVFKAKIGSVNVELFAGLYRRLMDESEIEEEEETRLKRDDAGWTIACNDRVVVYRDKTRLTGWGEADVPSFHGQFNAFAGLVTMQSDKPFDLPLTTTKRGIDASSDIYSIIKDYMRDATKSFTSFTNKWKRLPADRESLYRRTEMKSLDGLRVSTADYGLTKVKKLNDGGRFVPALPTPIDPERGVRIAYTRPRAEVQAVSAYLFNDSGIEPKKVGDETFAKALNSARKS